MTFLLPLGIKGLRLLKIVYNEIEKFKTSRMSYHDFSIIQMLSANQIKRLFYQHEFQTQSAITCSKLTIETLEQGVKYVILISLLLTLNIFHALL